MKSNLLSSINNCYALIFLLFALSLIAFYPGFVSFDSLDSFSQSLTGKYTHQRSPIYCFVWSMLNHIHQSTFIMLLFQQLLLWGSVMILVNSWYKKHGYSWKIFIFILIPFFPTILKMSGMISKDVQFAFSYLLVASILIRYTILPKLKANLFIKFIVPILIFYGTGIKFQAFYLMPIFIFWYLCACYNFRLGINIVCVVLISITIACSIIKVNGWLTNDNNHQSRVGWQEIKFHDLVYISCIKDKAILPEYILEDKNFDFEELKKLRKKMTSMLMLSGETPIVFTTDLKQQKQIEDKWWYAVKKYPITYLRARMSIMLKMLCSKGASDYSIKSGSAELDSLMDGKYNPVIYDNFLTKIFYFYIKLLNLLSFTALYIPFMIYYFYYGLRAYLKFKSNDAKVTLYMNGCALLFIVIMFFIAVTREFRYLYICHVLFHFSHIFAWQTIKEYKISNGA